MTGTYLWYLKSVYDMFINTAKQLGYIDLDTLYVLLALLHLKYNLPGLKYKFGC